MLLLQYDLRFRYQLSHPRFVKLDHAVPSLPAPDRAILEIRRCILPLRLVGQNPVVGNRIRPRPPHLAQKEP